MSDLTPDGMDRLRSDLAKRISKKLGNKPDDDYDRLIKRYETITLTIRNGAMAVRNAQIDHGQLPLDSALEKLVLQMFLDHFRTFTFDEILYLMCLMHAKGVVNDLQRLRG